ncbi:phosphotransferase [Bacillus sp. SCS-151]|uniref:phosphotransferase n=1 Tax=Nanhaiella sioensis TaxID=3115293 RepID=UPI00397B7896
MDLGAPLALGNTAKIYLYHDRIVKIFNDYLPPTEALYEANKQKYAYSCGLPVPKVYDVTKINGKQAIIMEYIYGRTMGDLLLQNSDQVEYYMNISIDIQQQIHMVKADPIETMSEKLTRQIDEAPNLSNTYKSTLIHHLNSMTFEKRLCHGDFHLFNLIMSENKVIILDWVDSSAGDFYADICRTYILYFNFSKEIADMYLRLYCEKNKLSNDDILKWVPIIAAAKLSENISTEESESLIDIISNFIPHIPY